MYNTIVNLGYGNKPIWITESGWASDNIGEQAQANYLTEMLAGMASRPWWKKFFWYQIWEGPTDRAGLLRQDETPKPAWYAYRDYTAAHPAPETVSVNLSTTDIVDGVNLVTVGDGNTTPDTKASRACRRNTNAAGGDYYMYFNVDDDIRIRGRPAHRGHRCRLLRPWDGDAHAAVRLHRGRPRRFYKSAGSVTLGNKDTWKQHTFYLDDAYFGNRQNNGADFRIFGGVGTTFYLDLVQVSAAQSFQNRVTLMPMAPSMPPTTSCGGKASASHQRKTTTICGAPTSAGRCLVLGVRRRPNRLRHY